MDSGALWRTDMATINAERKRVRWACPVTGRRKSRTFATVAAAKVFAAKCERETVLVKEDYLEPDDIERADRRSTDIAVLLADFRRVLERRQTSTDHRTELDRALRAFVKETRVASPRDLDVHLIDHYLQRIRDDGKSARTFNHHRSALSAFCRWLVDYRYLDQNPVAVTRSMDHTKDRRRISRALTVDECDRLVAATICPTRQALYRFRMMTGVRCREAGRLQWRDLDLGTGTLHLRPEVTKNGKPDVLPLADAICNLLAGLQRDSFRNGKPAQPDDPVFGPPPDPRTWARDLDRAGVKREVDGTQADPKCLRPTFNSHLERSGCDLTLTSLLMRHTPAGGMKLTLGIYGDEKALLERKRQAVCHLEKWVADERKNAKQEKA